MSSTLYRKGFEVQLTHNYYVYLNAPVNNEFKVNRDIAMVPTKECEELMRRGRLRLVPTEKGFTAFYQAYVDGDNAVQPLVELNPDSEFVFSMHMDVASIGLFLNVSNLNVGSKTYGPGKFFMLNFKVINSTTSPPATVALDPTLANSLRSSVFGYSFKPVTAWTGPADVKVFYESTSGPLVLTVEDVPYNSITKTYDLEINLSNQKKGFYVLKAYEANTSNEIKSDDFYVDGDLAAKNTFGIVRIIFEGANISKLYESKTGVLKFYKFNYAFNARVAKWRYYVVAESLDANFFTQNDLKVLKSGVTFHASFPGTPFSQVNGQPDPVVKVNGKNTVIFESTTPIAFTEAPQLAYELWRDPIAVGPPDERMVANLPNAGKQNVDSDQWGAAQNPPTITADISEIYVFI